MTLRYFANEDLLQKVSGKIILTACLAVFVVVLLLYKRTGRKRFKLPPGPTGLPILGYLPFLGSEPHKELDRLKTIYGNVFSIRMGLAPVVILGDFEAVKDALSKSTTINRPPNLFDFLPDDVGFGSFGGEEWSEQRKFCMKSMKGLGVGKDRWESIIEIEVKDFIQLVSSFNGQPFDFSRDLMSSISNNISNFVFGERLPFNHPDRIFLDRVIEEFYLHFNSSNIFFYFPIIRNISVALGIGSLLERYKRMVEFNSFFRRQVEKLKKSYKNNEHDNLITDYLKEMDSCRGKTGHYFKEKNLLGNIQVLFLAGSDTVSASLSWLFLAMAKFPEIQAKLQQEVDSAIGDKHVQWSDRHNLPYTFATILEAQRWRTLVPLNASRMTSEDIKIQNYDIPKGTTIVANFWGVHNDRRYWKEPEKFDPQRFLTEDGKQVIAKLDSFVPFSYGKRNCPGENIALMEILMYFTSLLQRFTVRVPRGRSIDLVGKYGLTYPPKAQELLFVPREQVNLQNNASP